MPSGKFYTSRKPQTVYIYFFEYTNLRPVIPHTCPPPLQGLIQRCWVDDAKSRPDFKEIVEELKAIQFSNPMGFASDLVH